MNIKQIIQDLMEIRRLPEIEVDLMLSTVKGQDPFYEGIIRKFCDESRRRHRKFPLLRAFEVGVALCKLPKTFDEYFMMIEASARRNYKKAQRKGYEFIRIDYNDYKDDIREIRQSTRFRQGAVSKDLIKDDLEDCFNPVSKTKIHDYPYYGILKDGKLRAYAGCLIAGEACMIEQLLGHADYQEDGVVPMLIIDICRDMMQKHPAVKFYIYGSYYGARVSMKKFKRKFRFLPCKAQWRLGLCEISNAIDNTKGVKKMLKEMMHSSMPIPFFVRPVVRLLHGGGVLVAEFFRWFYGGCVVAPVVKSMASVGPRLRVERIPYVRGGGEITIGSDVYLSGQITIAFSRHAKSPPAFSIGNRSFIGHRCFFSMARKISIGDDCMIAGGVCIQDNDGHPLNAAKRHAREPVSESDVHPVTIEDGAWIARNALILKGVTIGRNAVVGAGAVVVSDVASNTVVVGNPAVVVKTLDSKE